MQQTHGNTHAQTLEGVSHLGEQRLPKQVVLSIQLNLRDRGGPGNAGKHHSIPNVSWLQQLLWFCISAG